MLVNLGANHLPIAQVDTKNVTTTVLLRIFTSGGSWNPVTESAFNQINERFVHDVMNFIDKTSDRSAFP